MTTQPLDTMSQDEFFATIRRLVPMFESDEMVEKYMKMGVTFQLTGTNIEGRQVCNVRYAMDHLDAANDYVFSTSAYFKECLPVVEDVSKNALFELLMRKYDLKTRMGDYLKESKRIRSGLAAGLPLAQANELLAQCADINNLITETNETLKSIQQRINELCAHFPDFKKFVDDEYIPIDLI